MVQDEKDAAQRTLKHSAVLTNMACEAQRVSCRQHKERKAAV